MAHSFPRRLAGTMVLALVSVIALGVPSARASDVGVVVGINGAPTLDRAGKAQPLPRGGSVQAGDIVATDEHSKIKILLADDSVLAIGPHSRVAIDEFAMTSTSRRVRLGVTLGRFKLAIAKFFGNSSDYEVRTPTAVAGVRGTVLWGDTELDAICALDGAIEVRSLRGNTGPQSLSAGRCVNQMAAGKLEPLQPTAEELAGYLKDVTLE